MIEGEIIDVLGDKAVVLEELERTLKIEFINGPLDGVIMEMHRPEGDEWKLLSQF